MVDYKVAASLLTLKDQLNAAAPKRGKLFDGFIGDAAHQTRDSDHNPWWLYKAPGDPGPGMHYVTAGDFTHDPAGGLDGERLVQALLTARDLRVKYIIHNRRIWDSRWVKAGGKNNPPWTQLPYAGPNPHEHHVHVSVLPILESLSSESWLLPGLVTPSPVSAGKDNELPSVDEVWAKPVDDFYTPQADTMPVGVAVAWAAANAGHARDAAADAVRQVNAVNTKLDRIAAALGVKL